MLKTLRKNTKLIIWIVVFSFGLWGAYSVGLEFQKERRMAGEVFGKSVSFQEFDRFSRAAQIFSYAGETPRDPEEIRRRAWESLLFSREAQRRKIEVADDEVRDEVFRLLSAQKIENPSPELYRNWLQSTVRETPQEFEKQIRELLRIQKLLRQVSDSLLETPDPERVHKEFSLGENKLSAEAVKFPTQEEAQTFRKKVSDGKKWKKELEKTKKEKAVTGMLALKDLIGQWNLTEEDALRLMDLDKAKVSEALPSANQYVLFYILDKQAADEEKFEKEFKQKYADEITERKRMERFFLWTVELKEKAGLKDYLPREGF